MIAEKNFKRVDQLTAEIITVLNGLLLKAQMENLTAITTILTDARESIVSWAVHDDYKESITEKIVNQANLDSGLYAALEFLAKFAAIKDTEIKEQLLQSLTQLRKPIAL